MSCGSESFCPWNTTTSRSRHASSMVLTSSRATGFETSMPPTSTPRAASRFLIDIAIAGPRFAEMLHSKLDAARLDRACPSLDLVHDELGEVLRRSALGQGWLGA